MNRHINGIVLLVFLLLLAACGSGPSGTRTKPSDSAAKNQGMALYAAQEYYQALQWLTTAWQQNQQDLEVYVALLDARKQLGEYTTFWQLINESALESPAVSIMQAEVLGEEANCEQALQLTTPLSVESLAIDWQQRFWQLQAQCQAKTDGHLSAVDAWVQLEALSDDPLMSQVWHNEIVNQLVRANRDDLIMAIGDDQYDWVTQGWFEAAYVNFGADGVSGSSWLQQWDDHPAAPFFLDLSQVNQQQRVAVLLPLSGRFQGAAKAIQKGMLAATSADLFNQYELQFYDTGSSGEQLAAAWYAAQENNVDMIIGPLDKASIDAVELMPAPTVPVVLLNQSNADYLQFTLSPEGEAEQVAHRMYEDGLRRVVILAPNETWGERMTQAFAQKFVDLGGQIIDNDYFQPELNDFSAQLRIKLGLIESQLRARNLQSFLQLELAAEEVVRSDMDGIFLAARPDFARLMVPQLKFHRAADVPVYATSHVFDGAENEQHSRDLQGVVFAISPIEFPGAQLREILPFELNQIGGNKKLFALGFDAYQLITRLEWMSRVNIGVVEGLSGYINLNLDGQFNRGLQWAQYLNGSIVALPD